LLFDKKRRERWDLKKAERLEVRKPYQEGIVVPCQSGHGITASDNALGEFRTVSNGDEHWSTLAAVLRA
jgi:hypothetical protein